MGVRRDVLVVWVPARQARRRDEAAEGEGVWAVGWEGEGRGPRRDEAVVGEGMLMVVWRLGEGEGSPEGDISCFRNKLSHPIIASQTYNQYGG